MLSGEGFSRSRLVLLLLLLILALGSGLRLAGLANQSLWHDELASWEFSRSQSLDAMLKDVIERDTHPPAYQILLYYVEKYLGDTEVILRLPSAIAGVITIVVVYFLARRLYSDREGLIAAGFTAVLWCPIYYSQEARNYSLLILFTALVSYWWVIVVGDLRADRKPHLATLIALVLSGAVTAYLNFYGLFLVALQGLLAGIYLFRKPAHLVRLGSAYLVMAFLYLPWVPIMIQKILNRPTTIGWIRPVPASFRAALWILDIYLRYLFNESQWLLYLVLGLGLMALVVNLVRARREVDPGIWVKLFASPGTLLLLWLVIPYSVIYALSMKVYPVLMVRFILVSLPAVYILLARSITTLPVRSSYQTVGAVLLGGVFLVNLFFSKDYYTQPHKQQFREAVQYVVENDRRYPDSLLIGYTFSLTHFNYYFEHLGSSRRVELKVGQGSDISRVSQVIDSQRPSYIWYIYAFRYPDQAFLDFLTGHYRLLEQVDLFQAGVLLFENPVAP